MASRIKHKPVKIKNPDGFTVSYSRGYRCWVAEVNENDLLSGIGSTKQIAMEEAQKNILMHCYEMQKV